MKNAPLKNVADHLASKGRYGDTMLVHMNPHEVRGLAAMTPGGKLTINPDTGQPEAFLPFLAPIIGGLAGSAFLPSAVAGLGLGTISSALGGAIGAGGASFLSNVAQGKDVGSALGQGLASGLLSYGLGSALDGLAGGAEGAGGVASDALKGWGEGAAQAAPEAAQAAAGSGLNVPEGIGGGVQDWVPSQSPEALGGMAQAKAPSFMDFSKYGRAAENLMNPSALKSTFIDNFSQTTLPIGLGIAGGGLGLDMGGGGGPAPQQQQQYQAYYPYPGDQGTGRQYRPQDPDPLGRERTYFYREGGEVMGEALAIEDDDRYTPWERDMPYYEIRDGVRIVNPAQAELDAMEWDRQRAFRKHQPMSSNPFDRPREMPVTKWAAGGGINGPGGGLDDAIPAIIDGRAPAKLSSGEYVVPAHAVSALGNGSTEEGVRQLDGMVDRTMMSKFGTKDRQPNKIKPEKVMPKMADGGRVRGLGELRLALLGERMEDARGNTYESIGPNEPDDFNPEDYGGRFPTYDYPDGKMDVDLGGKRYFRTLPPGTLRKYPNKHMPLEWMRKIEGFPTS